MVDAKSSNMVLRTIYLPEELDLSLRQLAFSQNVSKGELIRRFIADGITALQSNVAEAKKRALEQLWGAHQSKRPAGRVYIPVKAPAAMEPPKMEVQTQPTRHEQPALKVQRAAMAVPTPKPSGNK